jgi:pentatricopeptide repeat protein
MGLDAHPSLGNALVSMLVGMRRMEDARQVFDRLQCPSETCWNCLIQGYIRGDELWNAFALYQKMEEASVQPSGSTCVCLLKRCSESRDLETCCKIWESVWRRGSWRKNTIVGNALINACAKCGMLARSQEVFDMLPIHDVVAWSILTDAYLQHGQGGKSLQCWEEMQLEGVDANAVTYLCGLKACSSVGDLEKGREMHEQIEQRRRGGGGSGWEQDPVILDNALVDMYAKCGCLRDALLVFDRASARDVCSWNSLITGYAHHDRGEEAIELLERMQQEGICPNDVTFVCALNAAGCAGADDDGSSSSRRRRVEEMHCRIANLRYSETNPALGNMLVDAYARCGMLACAEAAFDSISAKDVVAWTSLIAGYAQHELNEEALQTFELMMRIGKKIDPNAVTFACVLKSCASARAPQIGRRLHIDMAKRGLDADVVAGNALIDMYAKCGLLCDARRVLEELELRDAISWNALITGYVHRDEGEAALGCLEQMRAEGIRPNAVTFVCILSACGILGAIDEAMEIHAEIKMGPWRRLAETHRLAVCAALVGAYAKCGLLAQAQEVFDELVSAAQDTALWNTLITGYAEHRDVASVLALLKRMEGAVVEPDAITTLSVLSSCSHAGLVGEAMVSFEAMLMLMNAAGKPGIAAVVGIEHWTCVLDLLSRAGRLQEAQELFDAMPFHPHRVMLAIVMGACQRCPGFVELGEATFGHALQLDGGDDAGTYIGMWNVYAHHRAHGGGG